MKTFSNNFTRWLVVVVYAIAMAWVESAVVLYLRTLTNRLDPYQPNPLPVMGELGIAELIREAATLVMLATVGWLAGGNFRTRAAYGLIAFGVWDIFYYVFLVPITGWPHSLLDWDILFLLPLPWWGPVLAPVLIALLMVIFGTLVTQGGLADGMIWPGWPSILAGTLGIILALYVFMADALGIAGQGVAALREMLPTQFNWPLFLVALALMQSPVLDVARQIFLPRTQPSAGVEPAGSVFSAIEIDGEHTPPACGFRRLAETVVPSGNVSGAPPDTARGPRALPALNSNPAGASDAS